jgi:hypothetical protein
VACCKDFGHGDLVSVVTTLHDELKKLRRRIAKGQSWVLLDQDVVQ